MKMRLTPFVSAQGAWLIAGRSTVGAVLLALTVSACTGTGSPVPSISGPTPQTSGLSSSPPGTRTPSLGGGSGPTSSHPATHSSAASSASAHASSSHAPTSSSTSANVGSSAAPQGGHASVTPTSTPTPTPSPMQTSVQASPVYPTAAPETGGGGTAGLQDGLLFGVGGAAVLAGLGALGYRRRLSRKFGVGRRAADDQAPRDPANR
jgi:hypothetical protein